MDLKAALPYLLPKAIAWAEIEESRGLLSGRKLSESEQKMALHVGVKHPEKIRLISVETVPMPSDPLLRVAAEESGFLNAGISGLTLGYAVFICKGMENSRLLSHEFRHVYQYEQAGSLAGFLREYLKQVAEVGYEATPFEIDAQDHEC